MHLEPDLRTEYLLKRLAASAEESSELLSEQLDIIYSENWFRLFVPQSLGGIGANLIDGLRLEESLAKIDGSLGWTVTLCSGASLFVGFIEEDVALDIYSNNKVCFAGSGRPAGIAKMVTDGYIVNGLWNYATGAPYATVFTANCKIEKDGALLLDSNGYPEIKSFLFKKDEVIIHNDWNTMGLKASAGDSFSVHDLHVKANRSFIIDAANATLNDVLFQYPFLQFSEATLAVNTLGMALHFLKESDTIFHNLKITEKQRAVILASADAAIKRIEQVKTDFYKAVSRSWQELVANNKIQHSSLKDVSIASRLLAKESRNIVTTLYPYCGLSQTKTSSTVNRILRDIFTASQHTLLNLPEECYTDAF